MFTQSVLKSYNTIVLQMFFGQGEFSNRQKRMAASFHKFCSFFFSLNTGKRLFAEVSFKSQKTIERTKFPLKNATRDF